MKRELQKLWSQKLVFVICAVFVVINGFLYYRQCEPYVGIKDLYQTSYTELKEETDALQTEVDEIWTNGTDYEKALELEQVITDNTEALERMEYQSQYSEWITAYIAEMRLKISSGLFGDAESSSVKELNKGIEIYQNIENVSPSVTFQGTAEVFLDWQMPFYFALIIGFCSGLLLFFQERRDGTYILLRPSKGYKKLFFSKTLCCICTAVMAFAVFIVTETLISAAVLGLPELLEPIQGVYGYQTVPLAVSVLTYCVLVLGWQILLLICVTALLNLVLQTAGSHIKIAAALILLIALNVYLASSTNLWLDTISFITLADAASFFNHAYFLFAGSFLLSQNLFAFVYLILLILIGNTLAYFVYQKQSPFVENRKSSGDHHLYIPKKLFSLELVKLLVSSGGIVILVFLLGLECFRAREYSILLSAGEYAYRNYSEVLAGEKSDAKEEYLTAEAERLETARQNGEQEEINESALQRAQNKYEALDTDQVYVYESGYTAYFFYPGLDYSSLSVILGIYSAVIVFSRNTSMEYETDVNTLFIAYGKRDKILKIKHRQALIYAFLIALVTYIPWLVKIQLSYGFDNVFASASLLAEFSVLPSFIPIAAVFLAQFILYVLIYFSVVFVCELAAKKTKTLVSVLTLTSVIYLVIILLVKAFV